MSRNARLAPLLFGALFLVMISGCRTYGGYGTTELIPQQMQQAVQQFEDDLERAESDILALSEATAQNAALEPAETQYRDLVALHQTFLEAHRATLDEYEDGGTYRALNREYGAMIAEQRLIEMRYAEMHARIRRISSGQPPTSEATPAIGSTLASRNFVNPNFYSRVQNRQPLSMQEALRGM